MIKIESSKPVREYRDRTVVYKLKNLPRRPIRGRHALAGKPKGLTVDQIVLLLLSCVPEPVVGRILLVKELFLLWKELQNFKLNVQDAKFVPYKYGPYSFLLTETLNSMEFAGLIMRRGIRGSRKESFELTQMGKQAAEVALQVSKLREIDLFDHLRGKRIGWDQLGTEGILLFVYTNFPEFTDRSRLKEKYRPIDWGRGKG